MTSTRKLREDSEARKVKEVIRLLNLALDECHKLLREIEPVSNPAEAEGSKD
jgi:hypothetical protein